MRRYSTVLTLLTTLVLAACATSPARDVPDTDDPHLATAYSVLSTTPLIDGHNDLPGRLRGAGEGIGDLDAYDLYTRTSGHTDIPRLQEGMVGGQFWSVYIPASVMETGDGIRRQLEQIDIALRMIDRYPEFELALTADDLVRIFEEGKIASMLGMEGGHALENSMAALRSFYRLGARYMTITHSANIDWADSCCEDPELGGLSDFGEEVIREMNRLGMLVDISHVAPVTMHDVLDVTEAPVIFSHSSAKAVTDHPRNVPDDVLRRLPENGGVVMVTYVRSFVNEDGEDATIEDVLDHIDHVKDVAGVDHVGIGSDYDGATVPPGLEDVSTFPVLFAELSRRGWTEAELRKLAGENVLRAWRETERVAERLQAEREPAIRTIAELDGVVPEGSAAFVTRLGDDTLAVERIRHGPTYFEADVLLRAPEPALTVYRADLDHRGNIVTLTAREYDPATYQPDEQNRPVATTRYEYGPGSVAVTRWAEGRRDMEVDASPDAIPFIDMVHWPYELALLRGVGADGEEELPMITRRRTAPFVFTPMGEREVALRHPTRGTMMLELTPEGGIEVLDAGETTRALMVQREPAVDLASLARRWAREGGMGDLSGRGAATGTIGGATVEVDYGVPRKRGREIFGGLVPYDEIWRTGANRATHISFDRDLMFGSERIPAGEYTLFTIPGPDEWKLLVNGRTGINGQSYDPDADVARIPMAVRSLSETVEPFTILVEDGELRLRWDRTEAYLPLRPAR